MEMVSYNSYHGVPKIPGSPYARSFLGQAPIFVAGMLLCWVLLPDHNPSPPPLAGEEENLKSNPLARIDFLGAFFLGIGILAVMLPFEIVGPRISWTHPAVLGLFGVGLLLLGLFFIVEARWAREPIFPLRLLQQKNTVLCYIIMGSQVAAQLAVCWTAFLLSHEQKLTIPAQMMYTVPLYFQVTERSSSTVAGAHLFPAVLGNALGGIVSGYLIHQYETFFVERYD